MAQPTQNPASGGTLGGAGVLDVAFGGASKAQYTASPAQNLAGSCRPPVADSRQGGVFDPVRRQHLRIFHQRLFLDVHHWSVDLHGSGTKTKRLCAFRTRREAIAVASRLACQLHVIVKGRWSGFYRKIKRAEYDARRRRIESRKVVSR